MRTILILLLGTGLLSACGSDTGSVGTTMEYTGKSTAVEITNDNAPLVAQDSYGQAYGSQSAGSSTQLTASGGPGLQGAAPAIQVFNHAMRLQSVNSTGLLATQQSSGTIDGDCGGSATYSVTYDDVDTTVGMTMSMNMVNYCSLMDDGVTQATGNGSMTMVISADFMSYSISFNNFSMAAGTETFKAHGNMSMTLTGNMDMTLSMSMLVQDGDTGKVFKFENFTLAYVAATDSFTMNGRIYNPDYGYVDIATTTPFVIGAVYPTSGEMVITGANGATATLTANSDGLTYELLVDADGASGPQAPVLTSGVAWTADMSVI